MRVLQEKTQSVIDTNDAAEEVEARELVPLLQATTDTAEELEQAMLDQMDVHRDEPGREFFHAIT